MRVRHLFDHRQSSWDTSMADDRFKPKLGRIRSSNSQTNLRTSVKVFRHIHTSGIGRVRVRGHVSPSDLKRGMGSGALAVAGFLGSGSRRVIVRARYTRQRPGDLGATRAHLRYIERDGVTREGLAGHGYDVSADEADLEAFLRRSEGDPHQFRFIVSPEDSARIPDLKPFIRDLMSHMEQDLGSKLDWVAVDHFNTGHPHTHIVIRGRDESGKDLIIARDYIGYGVRARAQALVTLELGPETELERTAKLLNEVAQERFTHIDRTLVGRSKDGIVVVASSEERPIQQTMRIGRLKKLEALGLAEERRAGVWSIDPNLESKLRQLGERADIFKTMQRALREAGIERAAPGLAVFESGRRRTPVIGKVVAVGLVDEITDRQYVIVDGIDGRAHYAPLGRIPPAEMPSRGMVVSLSGDSLYGRPRSAPRLQVLSPVAIATQVDYNGPTWLDDLLIARDRFKTSSSGFGVEVHRALTQRAGWLAQQNLTETYGNGGVKPKPETLSLLRQREANRLAEALSRQLNATHVPYEPGERVFGVYDRSIMTPTGKLAVICNQDTFTLAPWKPALEAMRGRAVTGLIQQHRVTWMQDRGREIPRA
jgi:type IV secretory pathway VirD2 relaxase